MAEYVELEYLKQQCDCSYIDCMATNCSECEEKFISITDIEKLQAVDAVERSKIDKAIEEMNNIDLNEYADNTYQLVNECIEILKRNVGE